MSETAKRLKELGVVLPAPADNYGAFVRAWSASDLIADLFGARGRHARNTVGASHVPLNALAVIEAVFEIEP
jgi:hypothetical protein